MKTRFLLKNEEILNLFPFKNYWEFADEHVLGPGVIFLPPPHLMETWVSSEYCCVNTHSSEIWHSHPCPSRPLYPGANTVNLSWHSCHLSRFPHVVAKLGIWPSVFFKPCDPDVEIKKELCYRIKQIQEALAVSASDTLKLQQADQHGNGKNSLWERGETQRKVMANPLP